MSNEFIVDMPIGLFTCQVAPGAENEICKKLTEDSQGRIKYFYDAFSDFDLIGIVDDLDNYSQDIDELYIDSDKLRDIQMITCFQIEPIRKIREIKKFFASPAMTVTLLNSGLFNENEINPDVDTADENNIGLKGEIEIAKKISNYLLEINILKNRANVRNDNENHWVLGSLGLPNLVLIQTGNNLASLLDNLYKLNNQNYSNVQFYHTIACIQRINNGIDWVLNKSQIEGIFSSWQIGISCFNSSSQIIAREIKAIFKQKYPCVPIEDIVKFECVFGKTDLLITPKERNHYNDSSIMRYKEPSSIKTIIDFLEIIALVNTGYQIRDSSGNSTNFPSGNYAFETKTTLSIQWDDNNDTRLRSEIVNQSLLKEKINTWFIKARKLYKAEKKLGNSDLTIGWKIIDVIQRFQITYNTPMLWELAYDMKDLLFEIEKMVEKLINVLEVNTNRIEELANPIREIYQHLEYAVRVFNFAIDKRLSGIELGSGNKVISNLSGLGNCRTLLAIRAIPDGLFHSADSDSFWQGFALLDFLPATLCLPNGIINMKEPASGITETWCKLGHETGHAYSLKHNLLMNPGITELMGVLHQNFHLLKLSDGIDAEIFVEELIANIFEYFYAYGKDFNRFRDTTWKILNDDLLPFINHTQITLHLLRTICVLFIHLVLNGLVKKDESFESLIIKAEENHNIYYYENLLDGIRIKHFTNEGNFQQLILKNIINPISDSKEYLWLSSDLARIDLSLIEKFYYLIDPFKGVLINLFNISPKKDDLKLDEISTSIPSLMKRYRITNELYKRILINLYKISPPTDDIKLDEKQLEKFINNIEHKKTCDIRMNRSNDVFLVILALMKIKGPNLSQRIAMILSLWDYYRRALKGRLYRNKAYG